jgi:hypothetical protein
MQLDELINQKIIDSGSPASQARWKWVGPIGIASYLGQAFEGLSGIMKTWNNQKQKMRELLHLDGGNDGDLSQVLRGLRGEDKTKIMRALGGPDCYSRYAHFAENGGDPLPVDPVNLYRCIHTHLSVGKAEDEIRKTIIQNSSGAWNPWPKASGNFRSVVNDSVNVDTGVARLDASNASGAAANVSSSAAAELAGEFPPTPFPPPPRAVPRLIAFLRPLRRRVGRLVRSLVRSIPVGRWPPQPRPNIYTSPPYLPRRAPPQRDPDS